MESAIHSRVQSLGDVELAVLLSMVAEEHCIFSTNANLTKSLQEEVRLTCIETFGLQPVLVECSAKTTVDEFNDKLLVADDSLEDGDASRNTSTDDLLSRGRGPEFPAGHGNNLDDRRIADAIIATGLDRADESVQVQAFELLRSRRIFTRSAMHVAPKGLLLIVILSRPGARLFRHLNDLFALSHFHDESDGLPHLDSEAEKNALPFFLPGEIRLLREQTKKVPLIAEMAQYLHNIVVFMRNSRYIKTGVTATATRHLRILSRALAPLHGLDYVPPSLVALAARKVYPHRLVLATAENETSLLWGSDPQAIREMLEGMTVEDAIEEVLASLETPL